MAYRWKVFTVVSLGVFMSSLDLFIVNIAFPDLQRDFAGTSLAGLSWVLSAYAIVFAALLVPAGRIADRIGRRRAFLGGLAAFTAASALCAVAPSVEPSWRRASCRRRALPLLPTSLGAAAPRVPARAPRDGGRALGAPSAASRPPLGPPHRRTARRGLVALGVPGQPAGRARRAVVAGARVLHEVARARRLGAPRPGSARSCSPSAIGALALGDRQGRRLGLGLARDRRARSPPRRCSSRRSAGARRATPRR